MLQKKRQLCRGKSKAADYANPLGEFLWLLSIAAFGAMEGHSSINCVNHLGEEVGQPKHKSELLCDLSTREICRTGVMINCLPSLYVLCVKVTPTLCLLCVSPED